VKQNFVLFGLTHWLILAAIPLVAWAAARHTLETASHAGRYALGGFLLLNELGYYGFKLAKGWFMFPAGMPLQLCDLTLWCTVVAALTRRQMAFEFAFFAGILGAGMAVITPDLWEPFPSYTTIYFFLAHGGIVATLLYLWWSKLARPEPGCVMRAMIILNGYVLFMGVFNWLFKTNYVYLCRKPENASLLDYFGPWPVYLLVVELVALAGFFVMSLPFRRTSISAKL
jgi:hypothetical integral membrane protein (TIGR02206 family)